MSSTGGITLPEIKFIKNISDKYTNNMCRILLHYINLTPKEINIL